MENFDTSTVIAVCALISVLYGLIHLSVLPIRRDIANLEAKRAEDIARLEAEQAKQAQGIAKLKVGQAKQAQDIAKLKVGQAKQAQDIADLKTGQAEIKQLLVKLGQNKSL